MSQDTLSDLLRSVRLRGVLFFHVDCAEPWVTEAPQASVMAPAVLPGAEHLMEYHIVVQGTCWAALVGEPAIRLEQGDVVVFPHGDAHIMSSAPGLRAEPDISFLFDWRPPQLPFMLQQGVERLLQPSDGTAGQKHASLLCGFLGCDRRPFNPLLSTLPRMIHSQATGRNWASHLLQMAANEAQHKRPGGEAVLERMSEMMFVDLLRGYLEELPQEHRGWLAGLRDRHVGRVLALMHEFPTQSWTLEQLAERAGLSRSALHDRFLQFVGIPPMQYLTNWRMQIASRLLIQGHATMASIALECGYESEAAFSRAFKRSVGIPPSVWRRRQQAGGDDAPRAHPGVKPAPPRRGPARAAAAPTSR